MNKDQIVYVVLRFPRLTETFVAEEIRNIKGQGVNLRIYSLLHSPDAVIHPVSQQLLPEVQYAPGLLSGSLWLAQAYYLFQAPAAYFSLLTTILRQPSPHLSFYLKRMVVFLKGIWMARQLEHTNTALIHAHFAWLATVAGIVVSRLLGISFTFSAHAYDIYSEKNDLLRLASHVADGIITISDANQKAIVAMNPGLLPGKVRVIRCGIDMEYFQPSSARTVNPRLQITSVGRLLPKKGHEYLIRACGELNERGVDFECVIVGGGDLQHSLDGLVGALELGSKVQLVGPQSQEWVRGRLSESDVFVLACIRDDHGDQDGIPVSIMEAMAMRVPVISTPISGIPELVRNEESGLLVRERDASALAAAMFRLAKDGPLRNTVIQTGRGLVCSEYDIRRNTSKLRDFFEDAMLASNSRTQNPA